MLKGLIQIILFLCLPIICLFFFSFWRYETKNKISYNEDYGVTLVQPNISQKDKWKKSLRKYHHANLLELSVYSAYKPISKNESFLLLLAKMIKESSTTKLLVLILATLPLILILPSILRSFKTDIVSLSKFANFDTVIYLAYICSNA